MAIKKGLGGKFAGARAIGGSMAGADEIMEVPAKARKAKAAQEEGGDLARDTKKLQTYYLPKELVAKIRKVAIAEDLKASHLVEKILTKWDGKVPE